MSPNNRLTVFVFLCEGLGALRGMILTLSFCAVIVWTAAVCTGEPAWTLANGKTITSSTVTLEEGILTIVASNPATKVTIPFDELSAADKMQALALNNTPYPLRAPAWIPGYRIRYPLRVATDLMDMSSRTVIARLPTGGWLKTNAADVVVQTVTGRRLPATVLAHDPIGTTIIQFKRNGYDRWYWASVMNTTPLPTVDHTHRQQVEKADAAAKAAQWAKMTLQKAFADKAETVRKLKEGLAQSQLTWSNATAEVAQWDKLLPEREAALTAAKGKIDPAKKATETAAAEALTAKTRAEEQMATLQKPTFEATTARTLYEKAAATAKTSSNEWISAKAALSSATATNKAAAARQYTPKQNAWRDAEAARLNAQKVVEEKDAALKVLEDAILPVRMASAKAATLKADADKTLTDCLAAVKYAGVVVEQGRNDHSAAEQLKNKSAATIAELASQIQPASDAAAAAKAAADQAVETARSATEAHWKLVAATDPTILQEGLTVEFREWIGDELIDWPTVYAGLNKSDTILGNAIVPEVIQNANPVRFNDPRNFASSYRGYLKITTPGIYRFFVNGDDASYLFIDGYKVYSRRGTNRPLGGRVSVFSVGEDIELEAGVHPFEIHQIVGNTPGAEGQCSFLWLTPGSKSWSFVPRSAFPSALLAVPVTVEEAGGGQVAGFQYGMDDTLSSDGVTLYLVRFEAMGTMVQPDRLIWDFGDGTHAKGRSVTHIYFREGDYEVSLKSLDSLPAYRRRVNVYTAPVSTSPYSLSKAVAIFSAADLSQYDVTRLSAIFGFLLICEQPTRWPLMERLCRYLLIRRGLDIEYRIHLYAALMEALAQQGRAAECMALLPKALAEVPRMKGLQVVLQLKIADIQWKYLKDFREASRLYEKIITENRRLRHPPLRHAAIAWGDMFMEMGDQAKAGEAYRLAAAMGEGREGGAKAGDATTRGALLRVAEQQLKSGNIRQSRRLLDRIENDFPEQKIEGLYRFLRAETDRTSGRYTEAIRNYEILLQLRQWAGYRAQALYGIADSFYRNHNYSKALEWLKTVKESFPDYYAQKNLQTYHAMVEQQLKRQEELGGAAAMAKASFKGCLLDFEPDSQSRPETTRVRPLPSMGIDGGYTWFLDALPPVDTAFSMTIAVRNLMSNGMLWMEFWYRTTAVSSLLVSSPYLYVDIAGDTTRSAHPGQFYLEPTFGEWRKCAVKIDRLPAHDITLVFQVGRVQGLYEFDGLKVLPITDQQNEALRAYVEGANPQ